MVVYIKYRKVNSLFTSLSQRESLLSFSALHTPWFVRGVKEGDSIRI